MRAKLTIAVGLLLVVGWLFVYGIDYISVAVRGTVTPSRQFHLVTDGGGIESLDGLLDTISHENGLLISRAPNVGPNFPQPRELWRPGLSVFVMNEFECRKITEPTTTPSLTRFTISVRPISFLATPAYVRRVEARISAAVSRSSSVRLAPNRLTCP